MVKTYCAQYVLRKSIGHRFDSGRSEIPFASVYKGFLAPLLFIFIFTHLERIVPMTRFTPHTMSVRIHICLHHFTGTIRIWYCTWTITHTSLIRWSSPTYTSQGDCSYCYCCYCFTYKVLYVVQCMCIIVGDIPETWWTLQCDYYRLPVLKVNICRNQTSRHIV